MNLVNEITNEAKQKHTLVLPSGESVVMYLEYKPMQTGWFARFLYQDFEVKSLRVVTSPNLLHQFVNLLPFGVGVFLDDNQEPLFQDDFSSKRAKMYLLTEAETQAYEDALGG